ncbi:hypothetical protein [uncultured Cohaesibacter sp.]|uniref:hypothetical protein n=1 Tax=uncultured Cohaesibacter sp. TaxID=1002546 RepID=UPI003747E77C
MKTPFAGWPIPQWSNSIHLQTIETVNINEKAALRLDLSRDWKRRQIMGSVARKCKVLEKVKILDGDAFRWR